MDDPAFQEYVKGVFDDISELGPEIVLQGIHYYQNPATNGYLVMSDQHTTAMIFTLASGEYRQQYLEVFKNEDINQDQRQIPSDPLNPDAGKGEFRVHTFAAGGGSDIIVIKSNSSELTVADSQYKKFVEDFFYNLVALGRNVIWSGMYYYALGDKSLISESGQATIIPIDVNYDEEVGLVYDVIEKAEQSGDFTISITGEATVNKDFTDLSEHDLKFGELMIGLPIAIIVLILVFGAVVSSAVPLIMAVVSIIIALGLSMLFSKAMNISVFLVNMVFMMGFALGIDYCIFIIARYREERAQGWGKYDAIERVGATASRAVLFSGITVFLALIALMLVPHDVFVSLGLGAVLVALVSIAASLTLLPAILGLLGDRVNSFRVPFIYKKQANPDAQNTGGMWDRISHAVMRAPVVSVILCGGLLIAAAIPILYMHIGVTWVSSFPDSLESKKGLNALQQDFAAGLAEPTIIVIDGDIDSAEVQEGIDNLKALLAEDNNFGNLSDEEINPDKNLEKIEVPVAGGDAMSSVAITAVKRLRKDYVPAAFADTNARVLVGGQTAEAIDHTNIGNNGLRVIIPFILCLSFILLTLVFRSIIIPIKAVIMNLLSVGAAYGLIVLVFQKGVGASLFGFQQVDLIEWWVPAFLFCILFGLSMDYHVFLLSRIRERFHQTGDNTESVAYGIRSTGRLITGAAAIMIAVFIGFASGELVMFQQMGFGLAVAVFLDATLVRSILVPASMKLLGSKNWYLPSWLKWLPQIRAEEELEESPVTAEQA